MMLPIVIYDTPGKTLYLFPDGKSLSDWLTYRVLLVEGTGANTGRYLASVDTVNGYRWVVFAGETQPANWIEMIPSKGFDLAAEESTSSTYRVWSSGGLLHAQYAPSSSSSIDFFCRNASAQWWNGTAYEDFVLANYATYRIAATESPSDSGLYEATQPSGAVVFELRVRAATWAGSLIVAGPAKTDSAEAAELLDAWKADAVLGTGAGGLVANVGKIPRAATAVTDGGEVTRNKVSATSTMLTETLS